MCHHSRLNAALRDEDLLVRLGGDEFAVLCPTPTRSWRRQALQSDCVLPSKKPVRLEGLSVTVTVSIGIASSPTRGCDVGTLLRHADIAMYRAKRQQVGFMFYTPEVADAGSAQRHTRRNATARSAAVLRSRNANCACTISPRSTCDRAQSLASRHWSAGITPSTG